MFPEIERIPTERFSEIVGVLFSISAILLSLPSEMNRDGHYSQIGSIWSCFDHSSGHAPKLKQFLLVQNTTGKLF